MSGGFKIPLTLILGPVAEVIYTVRVSEYNFRLERMVESVKYFQYII